MRISLALFTMLILVFSADAALAKLIDFEDLSPADPNGYPTDATGKIRGGYQGFDWAKGPMENPNSGHPRWASLEGYFSVPGTDTAYVYGRGLSMSRNERDFNLLSLDVGSYFYTGQSVLLTGWDNEVPKYRDIMTIGSTFQLNTLMLNYSSIDRLTLWAGNQGTLAVPFNASHLLCIDNISVEDAAPDPVPEPSTLLILGAGILGFTSIYRKFRLSRERDLR